MWSRRATVRRLEMKNGGLTERKQNIAEAIFDPRPFASPAVRRARDSALNLDSESSVETPSEAWGCNCDR